MKINKSCMKISFDLGVSSGVLLPPDRKLGYVNVVDNLARVLVNIYHPSKPKDHRFEAYIILMLKGSILWILGHSL